MKPLSLMPLIILIIQTLLFTTSCKQTTEPKLEALLKLELEDASCTEAWIRLTTTNLQFPATINLLKNGNVAQTISLWREADTVLYVDSLLPNQTYRFKSIVQSSNHQIRSNELSVTTMDTTSHEFIWQSWEFGTIGSSTLYDVAIIDENDIWAVGEINIADTSINGYTTYNAVHWDGTKWELKRIQFYTFCGQQHTDSYPAKSVFAFGSNDVWIAMDGSQVVRWNGNTQSQPICTPVSINKLWGSSSEDLYAVGNNGNIAHWDGRKWTKIESGTDVDLLDVWGTPDGSIVWASGKNDLNKTVLIKIEGVQANLVFEDYYPWQIQQGRISGGISSIWTDNSNFIYLTTPITAYRCLSSTSGEGKEIYPYDDHLNGGTVKIRGISANNIITSGSNSSILHYNGFSWKRYEEFTDINTYLGSSDIKGNTIISVGDRLENIFYYKAIIIVGRK